MLDDGVAEREYTIYKIQNFANGKVYIGKTVNFDSRMRWHRSHLSRGVHDNPNLLEDWTTYGEDNFVFEEIDKCFGLAESDRLERKYIYEHKDRIYNLESGGTKGKRLSSETRTKIGAGNKGKVRTESQRKVTSENHADFSGFNHPQAKLTKDQVITVLALLKEDIHHKEIAKQFGVSKSIIRGIKNGTSGYLKSLGGKS